MKRDSLHCPDSAIRHFKVFDLSLIHIYVFRNILPGLALFEVCYKMAVGFLLRPVFSWLADHALSRNAELAFNERIVGALVTPAGVLGIFLFLVLGVSAAYYEFTVLFLMAGCAARQTPCRLRMAAELAVPALRILKSPGTLMSVSYTHLDVYKRQIKYRLNKNAVLEFNKEG